MNVFDLAMQMEKDGEKYYQHLAEKTTNAGMKNILSQLALDEAKHYQVLLKLKESSRAELASTPILTRAKNIFQQLREEKNWDDLPTTQADLYRKAKEIEIQSFKFYMEKAREATDPRVQKMFFLIAEEEKRHEFLLEHILQLVSRPQAWLENAEFNHLDQY
ncbi:MAG: ferritin family protein [Candidatus Aminicenantes bacterium]|nr:ferritin family protein [Candidatus Aminicenantes bacterium]